MFTQIKNDGLGYYIFDEDRYLCIGGGMCSIYLQKLLMDVCEILCVDIF